MDLVLVVAGSEEDMVLVAEGMEDRRGRRSLLKEEEEEEEGNEDDEDGKERERGLSLTAAAAAATATATPAMDDGRRVSLLEARETDRKTACHEWTGVCLGRDPPTGKFEFPQEGV